MSRSVSARLGWGVVGCLLVLLGVSGVTPAKADALERLKLPRLKAVHEGVQTLAAQRKDLARPAPYEDFRAVIHLHSAFSHDSRGTLEEIVAAAKATGTQVLMFSEHPSAAYDPVGNGHRGLKDGVLLIPGVETEGFLVYPTENLRGLSAVTSQAFADQCRQRGGLVFLSHIEERADWAIQGLTGTEIYNTHADAMDEKGLFASLKNPLWVLEAMELYQKYPHEAFAALYDYPALYLKRWDELCQTAPHSGVAANDSHQNVGFVGRLQEGDRLRIEDALGKKIVETPLALLPMFLALAHGKKAGETIFEFRLDPYASSLGYVSTHLLATELSEAAVRETLQAGRAYVAFDWIADPRGFDFAAVTPSGRNEMGSEVANSAELRLQAAAPLAVHWKLFRNGAVLAESDGDRLEQAVQEPGVYRLEAWLEVAGEPLLWILSNPIYVRP